MNFVTRAVGGASRRLDRPELVAAIDADARLAQREELAIRVLLAATLKPDSTYVDVGANDGQLLKLAIQVAPTGRHVAFEPIPEHAARVTAAFHNVDCRALAVGDTPGIASFCHFRTMSGWSGLQRRPEISEERGRPEIIKVKVVTLDDELRGMTPGLIKIDVEGGELGVLRGAREILTRVQPHIVFEHEPSAATLYGVTSIDVWRFLEQIGYRVFTVTGEGPFAAYHEAPHSINWLASPRV